MHSLRFIILLGIVSFFADITHQGARSISGQYLSELGANAAIIGAVAGFGELIGYGFRSFFGYVSDKTGKYWLFTFIGYSFNLFAVPLLAFAGSWQMAAFLIVLERLGKGIRNPSRDAMLSHAARSVGPGKGFGIHKLLDQTGALVGPIVVTLLLYYNGNYRSTFELLIIPTVLAFGFLTLAKITYPDPKLLEKKDSLPKFETFSKKFWLYLTGISFVAAGYADFPLIAYHFLKNQIYSEISIPLLFTIGMGVGGVSAFFFGRLYDLYGINIVILITFIAAFFSPFVFLGGAYAGILGMILWGMGMASQESLMRAVLSNMVGIDRRGTAYGFLNMTFGIFWFLGSAIMGYVYDLNIIYVVIFSLLTQLAAIPILFLVMR